jgi:acyl-CoA synthetase (AMP-forming)/AMP-acid ligase II
VGRVVEWTPPPSPSLPPGGIIRNLLAPLLAGASTVLAPSFDAAMFWDVCATTRVTYYYAAPTMHQLILAEAKGRTPAPSHHIRMIANAAGGLLPSLAQEMRDFYG